MEKFDNVCIGDMTTDAFIRLKEARVNCSLDDEKCQLCVSFGDKIPYEFAEVVPAVGNSANAAVACARLGLRSALVSHVGDDEIGKLSVKWLEKDRVDTHFISVEKGCKSNYHYVLWYEAERTILVKHEKYPYRLPDIGSPKWVYLSSLSETAGLYQKEVSQYLREHPNVKLAFQPGTFQIKEGTGKLRDLYKRSEVFVCNTNEAGRILSLNTKDIGALLKGLRALGPKTVVITDGPKGAYAYDDSMYFMPPYPDPKPPYERTGAGDAFASTFTACKIMGKSTKDAFKWAAINAMSVVQSIGAQKGLLTQNDIQKYLSLAPKNFEAQKIF